MNILMVIATFIILITAWATTSVCDYNQLNETKIYQLNKDVDELGLNIKNAEVVYGKKIDCKNFNYRVDFNNLMKNLNIIQKVVQKEIDNMISGKTSDNNDDVYKEFLNLSNEDKKNKLQSIDELIDIQNNIKKNK
jgi:hypothetical protein